MRRLLLFCAFLNSCFAAGFNYRTQTGVVIGRSNELCLQIEDASLHPGVKVDLVQMGVRQSFLRAEVVRRRDAPCPGMVGGSSYRLRLLDGQPRISADAIAIVGLDRPLEVHSGVVTGDLDGDDRKEFFRSCASNEGIHFTIWSGKPLKGKRQFHAYHYVGYDLEPNCTDRDYAGLRD